LSQDRLNSLEEIRALDSGLKSFVKGNFQTKLKNELLKEKSNSTPDNTDYLKFLAFILLKRNSELKDLLDSHPELITSTEIKAIKILNLLELGENIPELTIFPLLSRDLLTHKKLAIQLSSVLVELFFNIKTNTNSLSKNIRPVSKHSFEETGRLKKVATAPLGASCPNDNSDFRNKSIDDLWELTKVLPELFYFLAKKLLVNNEKDFFQRIEAQIASNRNIAKAQDEIYEDREIRRLEEVKLIYLEILLEQRQKNDLKKLDTLLVNYHQIFKPDLEKKSHLVTYGVEQFHPANRVLEEWTNILKEANAIQNEIETLANVLPSTCEYFSCSDCCSMTFPTMSYTEYRYLKQWMQENNIDENLIKEKSELIQKDYENKFGERLKIIDKSKIENQIRGIENPHDYKFSCPFLSDEGKCSCHPARPLLCRGFGTATNNGMSIKTCNYYLKQYQHNSSPENERYVFDMRPMEMLIKSSDKYFFKQGLNRPVSKHSFEETGRLKKVATAPLGASCPNDNSDFRNKSNDKEQPSGTIVSWFSD